MGKERRSENEGRGTYASTDYSDSTYIHSLSGIRSPDSILSRPFTPPRAHELMSSGRRPHPLIWIMTLAVLLRAAVIVRDSGAFDDPDNYLPMARALATGQGFVFKGRPTAYRPPLYPLVLVPMVWLGDWGRHGIAVLHLGLGAGTVWMTAA